MTFAELAAQRYSVRKFKDQPVEREKLEQILHTASLAPTAVNYQPQRILVIESAEARQKLKACTRYHFHAPLTLLVCYDKEVAWVRDYDGQPSGEIDASIVTTHLMMAAEELGLGSTWVMHFDPQALRKAFHIPANWEPLALLPMGYPAETAQPNAYHAQRRPFAETTFYDDLATAK